LNKEVGTAVAYNSSTLHEIKEIHSGERWSIVVPVWKKYLLEKKHFL
jgi:predicted 2-oxoglutarate/Fe(II)-dependent dioxygenase YbiX